MSLVQWLVIWTFGAGAAAVAIGTTIDRMGRSWVGRRFREITRRLRDDNA